jgi:arylsulfatase
VVDFVPTLLDLAGRKRSAEGAPPLPGKSLVPAFAKDGAVARECLFFHHQANRALRAGSWKIVSAGKGEWELYDLSSDRCEKVDLASKHPDRVREMAAVWDRLEARFREEAGPADEPRGKKEDR